MIIKVIITMNSIFIESVGARLTNRSYIRVYHSRLQLRTNKLLNYSVVPATARQILSEQLRPTFPLYCLGH